MTHFRSTVVIAIVLLFTGLNSLATPQQSEKPPRVGNPTPNYPSFTNYFKGMVTKVLPDHVLMAKDEETKSFRFLELTPNTSLKAKKKSEFGGRKKLKFEDLAEGQLIKVTYVIDTGKIVKVLVLDRSADPP